MKPLFDFMAQKGNLLQTNYVMFSLQLWRQTVPQYHEMQVHENLCLQKLDFGKQGHGLKG